MSEINPPAIRILKDRPTIISGIICFGFLGGFLLWSILAPLAEGVTASGQIVVEDNRKVVQHLEGGIISVLHVKEGDLVQEGDILIELQQVASLARRDELANELATQTATIERLQAFLDDREVLDLSALDSLPITADTRTEISDRQQRLFEQQVTKLESEISVLEARRVTLLSREKDLTSQIAAIARSLDVANNDLTSKLMSLSQGWETIDRVQAVEREVANLEAELSRLKSEQSQARITAREVEEEIKSARAISRASASSELLEARRLALTATERLNASQDVLSRTTIAAPRSGKVLNLAYSTVGGVVSPGEPIMEIVPDTSALVAQVQVKPTDRDAVQPGQSVRAQFTAYKQWKGARIQGEVISISADLKQVPETGVSYYEARILLDPTTVKESVSINVIPGMPVEAFIDSGNRRTFMNMVIEPLEQTIDKGTYVS